MDNWQKFTIDFDYEKHPYEVKLPNGKIITQCWPNAGKMNSTDGSGKWWDHNSNIEVRLGKWFWEEANAVVDQS